MSSYYYRTFGYGIQISSLQNISMCKVLELVQTAPKYAKKLNEWLDECEIEEPTLEDLEEFDEDYCIGLALVLSEVIEERENIRLTACKDLSGESYLLYEQSYPWRMTEQEKTLTETDIQSLLVKYLSAITDEAITIDYYDPEDGG